MPASPTHDFSSLSVKDLLEAREAYHVHLAHLSNVRATAIGKYLIRDDDRNAGDPKLHSNPADLEARRLDNASPRPWSWPCVLVFVEKWVTHDEIKANPGLASEIVPPRLYLPDGRVVPTCVIEVTPSPSAPPAAPSPPVFKSDLVGGGFPIETHIQGKTHVGSIGCLVTDGDSVFALTNRHVTGTAERPIMAGFKNRARRLGLSDGQSLGKKPFAQVYPGWPGERVLANLDAGLVRIDDVNGWTAQVYGVGEISDVWDLNVDTFRLDVIDCPLVAFGAVSGEMKGRILGLFYRYKTIGGVEYVTDFVIGPRADAKPLNNYPGDSGTIWFEDAADPKVEKNASGARRLRPVAMEWGGQVLLAPGGRNSTQLALGICLSTICRELDIELIPNWNTGHTEYWGEWGHVKIGSYATSQIDPAQGDLGPLMVANADNIGLDDALLKDFKPTERGAFAPLADVADLVWRFGRPTDESNHFADMDKAGKDGATLLDMCRDPRNVDPDVWNAYYEGIGEDKKRGALPFRVWQIAEAMIAFARNDQLLEFVCAGGIVAHYVGDACQPLHISQFHHGLDPTDKPHAKVHSVYETTMIGRFGAELLDMIPAAVTQPVAEIAPGRTPTGHDIAVAVVALMQRTVDRLPPRTIVQVFDDSLGRGGQTDTMWDALKDKTAECMQDGAKTLARVWEATWRAAGAPASAATTFGQDDLARLYHDKTFLPSFTLDRITTDASGHIVPKAAGGATAADERPAQRKRKPKPKPKPELADAG